MKPDLSANILTRPFRKLDRPYTIDMLVALLYDPNCTEATKSVVADAGGVIEFVAKTLGGSTDWRDWSFVKDIPAPKPVVNERVFEGTGGGITEGPAREPAYVGEFRTKLDAILKALQ